MNDRTKANFLMIFWIVISLVTLMIMRHIMDTGRTTKENTNTQTIQFIQEDQINQIAQTGRKMIIQETQDQYITRNIYVKKNQAPQLIRLKVEITSPE